MLTEISNTPIMAKPRKHHFVQAEHIRQFVNEEGTVWVYAKNGKQFQMSPEAIFKQKDLNSYESEAGLDTQFEDYITGFENETFPAIKRVNENEAIRESDIVPLTAYVALSKIRNPSLQSGIIAHHRNTVTTVAKMLDRRGDFAEMPDIPNFENKTMTELLNEGLLEFEINNSVYLDRIHDMTKQTNKLLANHFGWSLVKSPRDRVIISDHPMSIVHPGQHFAAYGIPLGGADCEVAFPLSRSLYLLGLWHREVEDVESEDIVDELNRRQCLFANRHIAVSNPRRSWQQLAARYSNFGYQTLANSVDYGSGALEVITGGVFLLEDRPMHQGTHPLKLTRSVGKRLKDKPARQVT
jgi:hypothetical protein